MTSADSRCDEVLVALRRVIRAVGLHSRQLERSHGLTAPQALVLKTLIGLGEASVGTVARRVSLSQATVTDVLNRLENRKLVVRARSSKDRRRVIVSATDQAVSIMSRSPPLLQEAFVQRFLALEDWEQTLLISSLQRITVLMGVTDLDASPVLAAGPAAAGDEPLASAASDQNGLSGLDHPEIE
ncbi:MAG: MarR family transcriptional regulator [Gammaproteobacteria bacterium]|nr:MarR family transcriptional regulator [Gammaproteobacteria bacterium]